MSILDSSNRDTLFEIRDLMTRYPDFVVKSRSRTLEKEIPVFAFHSIDPIVFQEQLEYLNKNDYKTLSTEEYLLCLSGKKKCSSRNVMLTIDDGRQSVWENGYPLLKKYGMIAVLFILPGHTNDDNSSANFEVQSSSIQKRDELKPLLSWNQLKLMHSSGFFDIQSHTFYHHRMYVSPKIRGVYVSGTRGPFYTLPVPKELEGRINIDCWDILWGMPIYESQPLMAGQPRYLEESSFRNACRSHYEKYLRGKEDLEVQKEMAVFIREYVKKYGIRGRIASLQEMNNEMIMSLRKSKELIEEHLPGQRVRSVCWPYGTFCNRAINLAKEMGYEACFCSTLQGRKSNRVGDTPFLTVRLKNDYIFRLPGKGRRSLSWLMARKVIRRLRGETGY